MATSPTQPPPDKNDDALRKVKEKMQSYKAPVPEVSIPPDDTDDIPIKPTSDSAQKTDPQPSTESQTESTTYESLSRGLIERFSTTKGVETDRFRSRPWRQLPTESAIEYALFAEYLKPPLARGRDLESLADKLNDPSLQGWYSQLINTLSVPKYIVDGFGVKSQPTIKSGKSKSAELTPSQEAETRVLWWLAEHNYWPERSRLYDAWQIDVLAAERKLQIQAFAQEMHRHYVDHSYEMLGLLTESRKGLIKGIAAAQGQFRKLNEEHKLPPQDAIYDREGKMLSPANPAFVTRTIEWDPVAQLEAMHKISDRLFGPLPNMLDGKVSTVLDQSLALPPTISPNGNAEDGELTGGVPEKKRGNAPWMLERVTKIQAEVERRKLITAPERPEGAGENEKPQGA